MRGRRPASPIMAWAFFVALAAPLAAVRADPGPFEFTLAGAGSSSQDFDAIQFSGDAGLGVVLGALVIGGRQTITYAESPVATADAIWGGSTRGFLDFQFKIGPVAPFVGAMGGVVYGDLVNDQFIAGPEAGLKLYVGHDEDTFIFIRGEYQFFFEDNNEAVDAFEDGQWVFALGVGVRL
jgi:hypothetical protein